VPVARISAFVICFNRADVLATCLRALRFADELIVIDKSSTDGSNAIAQSIADRVVVVPWTPTVEETRTLALALCQHDWILFMDDDECLSAAAGPRIRAELQNPQAAIYEFALRHYILGRHDERAYYWPEHHVRLFRRGAVSFRDTIHAGITRHAAHVVRFPVEKGVCIHHFSNADVAGWIEKTNRYTANPDRDGIKPGPEGLAAFGHQRIDHWFARTGDDTPDGYPAAAALLRAVYDMVDGLKAWEAAIGLNGVDLLRDACARLDQEHDSGVGITADMLIVDDLRAELAEAAQHNATLSAACAAAEQRHAALSAELAAADQSNAALTRSNAALAVEFEATQGEATELRRTLGILERRIGEVESTSEAIRQELAGIRSSTSWRLTGGLRRVVIAVRGR
jgi:O-antigen biosynthesis protein